MTKLRLVWCLFLFSSSLHVACGNPVSDIGSQASPLGEETAGDKPAQKAGSPQELGDPVVPPFAVQGDLQGLFLTWFDREGLHTAQSRAEIPEASRGAVRVASPELAPEEQLDADYVYVADVREAAAGGQYPVRKVNRVAFDALVDRATGPVVSQAGVVVYKAAWCGACKAAEAYLKQRKVDYVARDVEKDPAAQAEMQRKVREAGLRPGGVPVIDVRGELLMGFNQPALAELLDK